MYGVVWGRFSLPTVRGRQTSHDGPNNKARAKLYQASSARDGSRALPRRLPRPAVAEALASGPDEDGSAFKGAQPWPPIAARAQQPVPPCWLSCRR